MINDWEVLKINFRKLAFNSLDLIQGKPMGKQLKDIKLKMEDSTRSYPNKKELNMFLKHATDTTKFYEGFKSQSLHNFPITNKQTLKENYNDFLSNKYSKDALITVTTSGSYGTPFTYHLTKEKRKRQQAEVIYFGGLAKYDIGVKHAYARVTRKSKLKLFLQNQLLINPTSMNNIWFEKYRNELKKGYRVIIGYPSTISALTKYCLEKGDSRNEFSVEGVITSAEPLLAEQKESIEHLFGCTVSNRYSTEEFGVIANSCVEGNLHINKSTFLIEVLEQDGFDEVKPGETGRIVVTDLYSHALPLIRYDVGDLGVYAEECSCGYKGKVFKSINGRQVETLYDAFGEVVSPFAINGAMRDLEGILQFQFIQENKDSYRLSVVPFGTFSESTKKIIKERFSTILGDNANFTIDTVSEITPLRSGKRPYIIQKYKV